MAIKRKKSKRTGISAVRAYFRLKRKWKLGPREQGDRFINRAFSELGIAERGLVNEIEGRRYNRRMKKHKADAEAKMAAYDRSIGR